MSEELKEVKQLLQEMDERNSKRFDRLEEMLTQLIGVVGATNQKVEVVSNDLKILKGDMPKLTRRVNDLDSQVTEVKYRYEQ